MKKISIYPYILLTLTLAACAGGSQIANVAPTAAHPTEQPVAQTVPPNESFEIASGESEALTAGIWMWIGFTDPIQQFSVDYPENYTLTFEADGSVSIKADCNNAIGAYTVDGSSIQLKVGPMTMAACPPGSRSNEFIKYLESAAIYFFEEGNLYLDLMADGGTMEFIPAEKVAGTGNSAPDAKKLAGIVNVLGNLSYSGLFPDQQITLADGIAYYDDGGSGHPFVRLIDHLVVTGDLNGDGVEDAVAFVVDYSTGSGDFVYLAPVMNVMTDPQPIEALMIGDRTPVKSMTIEGDQVIVEQIAHGPDDPACCPTWNVRKVFSLEDDRLVEQSSETLSKVSLDDLSGTSWKLVNLNLDQEPVLPETEITLQFDDRNISGSAGCNNYTSSVTGAEDLPQTFVVGPITTTKMLCSDPVSNQETTYLDRLAKVVSWRYAFGYLSLVYKLDEDAFGELLFAPQEENMTNTNQTKPNYVTELEAAYGAPSQAGFGSAVFYEREKPTDDLEKMALEKYRYFTGDLWERFGQDAWIGPWKEVYARQSGLQPDIVAELRGIKDPDASLSVPMILDNIEGAGKARAALSAAYDDPRMTDLRVYNLGDGSAMSGLLVAGRLSDTGEAIFLVFLLD